MQLTQGQSLLAVLALIYFSDCFYWCKLSGLVLSASRFNNWKARRPQGLLSNRKGGLVLLPVLPPLGWSHLVTPKPYILSPMGVCFSPESGVGPPSEVQEPVPLSDLSKLTPSGKELFLDGKKVADCPNRACAKKWGEQLKSLAETEDPDPYIRTMLQAEFNLKEFAGIQLQLYKDMKALRIANLVLLLIMFFYAPFMTLLLGLETTILLNMVIIFLGVVVNAILYFRTHARLLPEEKMERWGQSLLQCISWPMAIRGADALTRNTFASYHPLAAAAIILPETTFKKLAADWYRRLKYPAHSGDSPGSMQRNWHATALADTIDELLPALGWDPQAAMAAPVGEEGERSYCPRCHDTFTLETGHCPTCPETALVPLPSKD